MNCWEVMKCGRVPGGDRVGEFGVCPAYPDNGEQCARLLDTKCGPNPPESLDLKLHHCLKCEFHYSDHYKPRVEDLDTCEICGTLIEKGAVNCRNCR